MYETPYGISIAREICYLQCYSIEGKAHALK